MEAYATRFAAQRAAKRILGSQSAKDGVHFQTVEASPGSNRWTWQTVPGAELDALTAAVKAAVAPDHLPHRPEPDPAVIDDDSAVPKFLRACRAVAPVEAAAPAKKTPAASKKPAGKVDGIRKLRESAVGGARKRATTGARGAKAKGGGVAAAAPATPATPARKAKAAPAAKKERGPSKMDAVVALLKRPDGATVEEIATATGWQHHSIRGAFAGALKKKLGYKIDSEKVDGRGRVYRITGGGPTA